jgi:hypothetical protein
MRRTGILVLLVLVPLLMLLLGCGSAASDTPSGTSTTTTAATSGQAATIQSTANTRPTIMDTGATTTSTIPFSVPAYSSGITAEQVQALVANWSVGSRSEDWQVKEYQTIGDWAVAILHTDLFPEQLGEAGMLGAAFRRNGAAWFFADWVSVEDSRTQQAIELGEMGAPEEVWSYFGISRSDLTSTTSPPTTVPSALHIGVMIPAFILYGSESTLALARPSKQAPPSQLTCRSSVLRWPFKTREALPYRGRATTSTSFRALTRARLSRSDARPRAAADRCGGGSGTTK